MKISSLIVFWGLYFSFYPLQSFSKDKFVFPESLEESSQKLVLNGTGLREATIFKVDVYEAGLYLTSKSQDPNAILQSSDPKVLKLFFKRDVSVSDIREAWKEGFQKNCQPLCEKANPDLNKLNSWMKDLKEGDQIQMTFLKSGLELQIGDEPTQSLTSSEISKIMLSIWLGPKPPNESLKTGLLGISKS